MLTVIFISASHPLSKNATSQPVDKAMDLGVPSSGVVLPAISIRNGPGQEIDTPMPDANGIEMNGALIKRKVRESLTRPSYADAESSEDDMPLVWTAAPRILLSIISG